MRLFVTVFIISMLLMPLAWAEHVSESQVAYKQERKNVQINYDWYAKAFDDYVDFTSDCYRIRPDQKIDKARCDRRYMDLRNKAIYDYADFMSDCYPIRPDQKIDKAQCNQRYRDLMNKTIYDYVYFMGDCYPIHPDQKIDKARCNQRYRDLMYE